VSRSNNDPYPSADSSSRISIARSIISDPKILLLDEATSALDPRAERVVQDAIDKVSANKTTLIIAHKLATVMAADNIAVMNNGKVHEQGTHADLLAADGLYAAMVRAQDLGTGEGQPETDAKPARESAEEDHQEGEANPRLALQRAKSTAQSLAEKGQDDQYAASTLNYSLLRCIFTMLKEQPDLYRWYLVILLVYLATAGTYPGQAILYSRLIRVFTLTGPEAQSQANFYALMFFIIALVNLVAFFILGMVTNKLGQILTHRVRKELVERIIHLDQEFFDRPENSSGALTSKLSSVPSAIQELMSQNIGLILNVIVNVLACSIVGICFGWKLGLTLTFAGLTIIVAGGYVRIRLDQKLEASTEEQYASSAGLASEAVTSIRTVSLLTMESSVLEEYAKTLDVIVTTVIRSLVSKLPSRVIPHPFR